MSSSGKPTEIRSATDVDADADGLASQHFFLVSSLTSGGYSWKSFWSRCSRHAREISRRSTREQRQQRPWRKRLKQREEQHCVAGQHATPTTPTPTPTAMPLLLLASSSSSPWASRRSRLLSEPIRREMKPQAAFDASERRKTEGKIRSLFFFECFEIWRKTSGFFFSRLPTSLFDLE